MSKLLLLILMTSIVVTYQFCDQKKVRRVENHVLNPGQTEEGDMREVKLDSSIVSIVPDSIALKFKADLKRGEIDYRILVNKEYPLSMSFQITDSTQIKIEYYYLAFSDTYSTKKIDHYSGDTLYMTSDSSHFDKNAGNSMVFFKVNTFVRLKNTNKLKSVVFLD